MPSDKPKDSVAPARQRVQELLSTGHTPREIADLMHVSTQRVYALMDQLRALAKNSERAS